MSPNIKPGIGSADEIKVQLGLDLASQSLSFYQHHPDTISFDGISNAILSYNNVYRIFMLVEWGENIFISSQNISIYEGGSTIYMDIEMDLDSGTTSVVEKGFSGQKFNDLSLISTFWSPPRETILYDKVKQENFTMYSQIYVYEWDVTSSYPTECCIGVMIDTDLHNGFPLYAVANQVTLTQ